MKTGSPMHLKSVSLNIAGLMICLLDRVENSVGKGENAGFQHFLLFLQCFPKPSSFGSLKVGIVCQDVCTCDL